MSITRVARRGMVAMALATAMVVPAGATTLMRVGLDDLVQSNRLVLVGEVLDTVSYWNDEGTFILTDVRIAPSQVIKGRHQRGEITVTVMGGTVGDLTTLILGGPELVPGRSYVLFLNEDDLPGAAKALTLRDHCQAAFDIVVVDGGLRAVSQANQHPLVPDRLGYMDAPGGVEGFPLEALVNSLRDIHLRSIRNAEESEQ